MDLVAWRLQPHVWGPQFQPAFVGSNKLPALLFQKLAQHYVVMVRHHHINIMVNARHPPQKEVKRPPAGDIPRTVIAR